MPPKILLSSSSYHADEESSLSCGSSHSIKLIDINKEDEENSLLENVINDSYGDGLIFEASNRSFSLMSSKDSRTNSREYRLPYNRKKISYQWDGGFGGDIDLFDECLAEVSDCSSTCSSKSISSNNERNCLLEIKLDMTKKEPVRENTTKICREFGLTKLTSLVPSFHNNSGICNTTCNEIESGKIRSKYEDQCYRSLSVDAFSSNRFHEKTSPLHNSLRSITKSLETNQPSSMNSKKPLRDGSAHYVDRSKPKKKCITTQKNAAASAPFTKIHRLIAESKKSINSTTKRPMKQSKESGIKMHRSCPTISYKTTGLYANDTDDHDTTASTRVVPRARSNDGYEGLTFAMMNSCISPMSCVTYDSENHIDDNNDVVVDYHSFSSSTKRTKPSKLHQCQVYVPSSIDTKSTIHHHHHPSSSFKHEGNGGVDAPPRIPRRELSPIRNVKSK